MNFRDQKLLLLLIYPDIVKNYSEVTLSHMPIETNEFLIRHIFKSINKDLDTCFVKRQPGAQLRSDRWELILDCKYRRYTIGLLISLIYCRFLK